MGLLWNDLMSCNHAMTKCVDEACLYSIPLKMVKYTTQKTRNPQRNTNVHLLLTNSPLQHPTITKITPQHPQQPRPSTSPLPP
jgi:hypothetical protein